MVIYGFLKKCICKTTLQQYFSSKYCHKIYSYDAISTINRFKQLKRALESKLSNFKIFENCQHFVSFTGHNNQKFWSGKKTVRRTIFSHLKLVQGDQIWLPKSVQPNQKLSSVEYRQNLQLQSAASGVTPHFGYKCAAVSHDSLAIANHELMSSLA